MGFNFSEMNKKIDSTKDILERKITVFTETIWKGKVEGKHVKKWLENFADDIDSSPSEQINGLYLLSKFMYFGNEEVRELLRSLYRDKIKYPYVQAIRKNNSDTTSIIDINNLLIEKLDKTRFISIGNSAESSSFLLYYFRQENNLKKELFWTSAEVFAIDKNGKSVLSNPNIDNYIFIDDLCGSGNQILDEGTNDIVTNIKNLDGSKNVRYVTLFGTEKGLDNLDKNSEFNKVESVFKLDDSYKCFEAKSRYFKEVYPEINKKFAESICHKYKLKITNSVGVDFYNPLGHGSCQLLLGFFHNTPDNTLPILWHSEGDDWTPIFNRYPKIY